MPEAVAALYHEDAVNWQVAESEPIVGFARYRDESMSAIDYLGSCQ
jgi:hypothetical protein